LRDTVACAGLDVSQGRCTVAETIVSTEAIAKSFGEVIAVDGVTFHVEKGQVYGLLGPNGAGKTTILRMLTGLEQPSAGSSALFGEPVTPGCAQLLRVGAMVEQAAFVPQLSGMLNLKLWWEAGGQRLRTANLDSALSIAGLGDAINRKVRTYSQGMKQRLGFARLLLAAPELLILDEPTNGLDPAEIREIRELIGRLTNAGATVLLSSHHLSEVEQVCSHALVINKGRVVADGRVSDLIGANGAVYVEVDERDRALEVLATVPGVTGVRRQGDGILVNMQSGKRSDLAAALAGAGLRLETLMPTQHLEEAFLHLLEPGEAAQPVAVAS
jgi:ABC-2 type transport system ATP-binding protein